MAGDHVEGDQDGPDADEILVFSVKDPEIVLGAIIGTVRDLGEDKGGEPSIDLRQRNWEAWVSVETGRNLLEHPPSVLAQSPVSLTRQTAMLRNSGTKQIEITVASGLTFSRKQQVGRENFGSLQIPCIRHCNSLVMMAERVGFEPTVGFIPRLISNQVP